MRDFINGTKLNENQKESHRIRLDSVRNILSQQKVKTILDIGCGDGQLLELLSTHDFHRMIGIDLDKNSIEHAKQILGAKIKIGKLMLFNESLFTITQDTFKCEAITLIEVIEHLPENKIPDLEKILFEILKPRIIIITTPNGINKDIEWMQKMGHEFEWDQKEFKNWLSTVSEKYNYTFTHNLLTGPMFKRGTQIAVLDSSQKKSLVL